jgi:hypothetical protein
MVEEWGDGVLGGWDEGELIGMMECWGEQWRTVICH